MKTKLHNLLPVIAVSLTFAGAQFTLAQAPDPIPEVSQASHFDISKTLPEMAKGIVPNYNAGGEVFLGRVPLADTTLKGGIDTAVQSRPLPYNTIQPLIGPGFTGLGTGFPGFNIQYAPPDTNGAVGLTQYVQWVNAAFVILDKTTGQPVSGGGPFQGNALWSGFGGPCETYNDGDPVVMYDQKANRWIFTQFVVSALPYTQCFAVSTTSDARGPYFRFSFGYGNTDFIDYPKLGVWTAAYNITYNVFANGVSFKGAKICAIDRSAVLHSTAPTQICYQLSTAYGGLLPASIDGTTQPPAGSPGYIVGFGTNRLLFWWLKPNFATPSSTLFKGPQSLAVASFTPACSGRTCIPQPGTTQRLDSLADRLMHRAAYRNRAGTESLVINHSVTSPTSSSGIRWYELRIANFKPTVYQQGTYAPADTTARWMGSIAMNKCGDIMVGYSASASSATYPSIRVTGRLSTDPLGQLQTETNVVSGTGSQIGGLSRWGDYSAMQIDPSDDKTFWYTTEYIQNTGSFNWSTRIIPVQFSTCP